MNTLETLRSNGRRLLVCLATAREYKAALSGLGAPAAPSPGETVSWRRGGREYLVVVTGVGPVAAAASIGMALGRAEGTVDGVLNLGVAGGFDLDATPLGALVAATAEAFPEYGLRHKAGVDARGLGFPQVTLAQAPVFDQLPLDPQAAAAAMGLALPEDAVAGTCVTVAGVSADLDRAAILARKYQAAAESMEGFSLALAACVADAPFLELRAVSNRVGSREPGDWDLAGALTALGRAAARLFS